jgi:peptide/nickel transport system permease protein
VLEILAMIFLPAIMHLDPVGIDPTAFNAAPSQAHILGTDSGGRDVMARIVYGGRVSLSIGVLATLLSVVIGLPLGLLAGYYRGAAEAIVMRCAEMFQSFPPTILILVVAAIFRPKISLLIFLMGLMKWPMVAKLIYGNVLSVRNIEYVQAERTIGTRDAKILYGTVLPNCIAPLWISLAFSISGSMLTESALSFLGAGVPSPTPSWGNIIQSATDLVVLTKRWWMWIPAGLCLMVTVISINFVGEGIRDALDPKMKQL